MCSCLSPPSGLISLPPSQTPNQKKSSEGVRVLGSYSLAHSPTQQAWCALHSDTLYPTDFNTLYLSNFNDTCFIPCPHFQNMKAPVPSQQLKPGTASQVCILEGEIWLAQVTALTRLIHTTSHFYAHLCNFHFLCVSGLCGLGFSSWSNHQVDHTWSRDSSRLPCSGILGTVALQLVSCLLELYDTLATQSLPGSSASKGVSGPL